MKIRFLTGDKKGQISHAPVNQNTQLLVDAGLIEVIPYKDYRERLKDEMAQQQKTAPAPVACWGVQHVMAPGSENPRSVIITKEFLGEKTFFDAPPKDCPPAIVAKFNKELAVYAQIRADREHANKVDADRRTR
jgi:hypothetical protein